MRKGATAAFWVRVPHPVSVLQEVLRAPQIYSEFRLPRYPTLMPLIVEYDQGTDPGASLGPHWQQPGRSILVNHLVGIPEPNVPGAVFESLDRVYFTGNAPNLVLFPALHNICRDILSQASVGAPDCVA